MNLGRTACVAAIALSLAPAAHAGGQDVLDDLRDNGRIDSTWSCDRLLDGLVLTTQDASMQRATAPQVRRRCTSWKVPTNDSTPATQITFEAAPVTRAVRFESDRPPTETFAAPATIESGGDLLPWHVFVVGIVAGGLIVLAGAAAHRRRLRP